MGFVYSLCVAMRLQAVGPGARNDDGQVTNSGLLVGCCGTPPCALDLFVVEVSLIEPLRASLQGFSLPGLSPGVLSPFLSFPVHDLRGHLLMHRDLEPRL